MKLFIMTGVFETGKTTWISKLLEHPKASGLKIAGVYTPAVFEGTEKTAIDAELLPSREHFLLAPRRRGKVDGKMLLGWDFQPRAMERINRHLTACDDCDLLIIDELGPLELLREEGYTEGLRLLDKGAVPAALIVVRPSLLENAESRWGAYTELNPDASIEAFLTAID